MRVTKRAVKNSNCFWTPSKRRAAWMVMTFLSSYVCSDRCSVFIGMPFAALITLNNRQPLANLSRHSTTSQLLMASLLASFCRRLITLSEPGHALINIVLSISGASLTSNSRGCARESLLLRALYTLYTVEYDVSVVMTQLMLYWNFLSYYVQTDIHNYTQKQLQIP